MTGLDDIDRKLLAILQEDGRAPYAELGESPGLECHHVTGAWTYLMKVRVKNTRMPEAFLTSVIESVDGIQRTETLIVLSSVEGTATLPTATQDWAR